MYHMDADGAMRTLEVSATQTRFPTPVAGQAIVVNRYGSANRKAVIIHPEDFDLFERYRRIFGARVAHELTLTETAISANQLAERGDDEPDIDTASLDIALGA
jgi:hypothetical protein